MSDLTSSSYGLGVGDGGAALLRTAFQRIERSAVWKVPSIESPESVPSRCQTAVGVTRSKETPAPAAWRFESSVEFPWRPA